MWRAGATSVLVVGDRNAWQAEAVALLGVEGYAVREDVDGAAARDPACPYDLAVVELGLARTSAVAVCSALRARSSLPILAVARPGTPEAEVLSAYSAGADQCLGRTLGAHELLARVRSMLRRSPPRPRNLIELRDELGPVVLDLAIGVATIGEHEVVLTHPEAAILHALLRRPGRVVPREELLGLRLGGRPDRVLDSMVRQLRTKLEQVEGRRRIVAVRGVGFRFLPDRELPELERSEV